MNTSPDIEPGDIVVVEGGRFSGCVLTYVRPERGRHVVINNTYGDVVFGYITVPGVRLHRKGDRINASGTRTERARRWLAETPYA